MNKVYRKLLKIKIDNFVNEYHSSREVFEDLDKRVRFIHAGEYGSYREGICRELIKFAIPEKFEVGSGFLINSFDKVSTQCDLVIFDKNVTPLIQTDSSARFFPVEPVVGIGEIKSKLTISSLCAAAVKLAEIKKMKQLSSPGFNCVNHDDKDVFDPSNYCFDTMFSFLICEEIKGFDFDKLIKNLNKEYCKNKIEYEFRHNAIISLKDGLLVYQNQFKDFPKKIPQFQILYMPKSYDREFSNYLVSGDVFNKVSFFLISMSNFLQNVNIFYPEPTEYI